MDYTAKFVKFQIDQQITPSGEEGFYVAAVISSGRSEYHFWRKGQFNRLRDAVKFVRQTYGKKVRIEYWAEEAEMFKVLK